MQHDPGFAAAIRRAEPRACATTALGAVELSWVQGLDPAAVAADRGGKRTRQFLRNVSSELPRCVALGPRGDGDPTWIDGFPASPEFHRAVAAATSLPEAFAAFADRHAAAIAAASFRALVGFEAEMVRARRRPVDRLRPGPDRVVLSPWARTVELPVGTHALASALTTLLQRGAGSEALAACGRDGGLRGAEAACEVVLLAAAAEQPRPGALRELRVEPLAPLLAQFLAAHETPLPRAKWSQFASERDLDAAEVEAVAADFLREGVLVQGPHSRPRSEPQASAGHSVGPHSGPRSEP